MRKSHWSGRGLQAAGLSRSALSLHLRNKDDIFRSLTNWHFDTLIAEREAALMGFKSTARTVEDLRAAQRQLACVMAGALASGT